MLAPQAGPVVNPDDDRPAQAVSATKKLSERLLLGGPLGARAHPVGDDVAGVRVSDRHVEVRVSAGAVIYSHAPES